MHNLGNVVVDPLNTTTATTVAKYWYKWNEDKIS